MSVALGLAVLDMIRLNRKTGETDPTSISIKSLMPPNAATDIVNLNRLNKYRTYRGFRRELARMEERDDVKNNSDEWFHETYLSNLWTAMKSEHWGEIYKGRVFFKRTQN